MARLDLGYAGALLRVAPAADLVGAVARRVRRSLERSAAARVDADTVAAAAAALARAPRLFTREPLGDAYRVHFPDAIARFQRRAEAILAHEIDLFGAPHKLGRYIDWHRDPVTGRELDRHARELFPDGVDPKPAWELARAAHLCELGAAARLQPSLLPEAQAELRATIASFLDATTVGQGIHYASPLEVGLRAIHWLAALELVGGARSFSRSFAERLAARLLADAHFLAAHLEDTGVVPANHLLGDHVGLWILGLALEGAAGARRWQALGARGIEREAARQVGPDGAHFEASTPYHRFALELMLVADLYARAADRTLAVAETLHRMFLFVRGYLGPDGCEPAFGDGDDARLLPLVPRPARRHDYLLPVGAALFGDPELRPPHTGPSEEALWLLGPGALDVWRWLPSTPPASSQSFPTGGVHVLRSARWQAELRAGSYGQHGVGGHAHNDQLSFVAWLDGAPLVVDAGTGCYAADMVLRDAFRGTAAHSTVTIDGAEQSPILDGRPFALLDRARGRRVLLEDVAARAVVVAEHDGYQRLRTPLRHRRRMTLRRDLELLVIEDELDGRGEVAVALRFHLLSPARPLVEADRVRLTTAMPLGRRELDRAFVVAERALLVPCVPEGWQPALENAPFSERYGHVEARPLVTFRARLTIPAALKFVMMPT
jgi:hypothetical protein